MLMTISWNVVVEIVETLCEATSLSEGGVAPGPVVSLVHEEGPVDQVEEEGGCGEEEARVEVRHARAQHLQQPRVVEGPADVGALPGAPAGHQLQPVLHALLQADT